MTSQEFNEGAHPHYCDGRLPFGLWGQAILNCREEDGQFWVENGEYSSQVNYCPFCGAKAPEQVIEWELEG